MDVQSAQPTPLSTVRPTRITDFTAQTSQETDSSKQDAQQIRELKARDQVVRAHEAAHLAAAGGIAVSGASYSFQRGPDGVHYAIGGEVSIDTSKVSGDPNATLQKAAQIQAAALAPVQPSSQDRAIAARAAQMAIEAKAEINQQANPTKATLPTHKSSTENSDPSLGITIDIRA